MTFIHPQLLWLLPLAAIPIIIYYLMRFRSLRVEWGANYVLERALERLKKKLYLDQLILLALRVLACLALVMLFARPVSRAVSRFVSGSGALRVLVVDGSYSMLADAGGQTLWDRQVGVMKQLVGTWGRGERWSLLFVGGEPDWVVEDAAIEGHDIALQVLDDLEPGETAADLPQALNRAFSDLGDREAEVYVFSDAQASSWKHTEVLSAVPEHVRLFWVAPPAGEHRVDNLAVTRVRVAPQRALAGHPCRVDVSVRNFGREPVTDTDVELLVDGAHYGRESISLLPGQEVGFSTEVVAVEPGSHAFSARLGRDALAFDNQSFAGLQVVEDLAVAVCRGPEAKGKFDSAWSFMQLAAAVMARTDEEDQPLFRGGRLKVILCHDDAVERDLAGSDVVLIDAGTLLSPSLVTSLVSYVAGGGALVCAADESVQLELWNERLGDAGLLPAALQAVRTEKLGGDRFRAMEGGTFRFFSWVVLGAPVDGAEVVATFRDGSPFAVLKRTNPGAILLLASGLNGRTNNTIVNEQFYRFVVRMMSVAASGGMFPRTVAPGEPVRLRLPHPETARAVTFSLERREPVALAVQAVVEHPAGTAGSGLASMLIVRQDGSERVWYGVQGERVDSDLTPLTDAERETLVAQLGMVSAKDWDELNHVLEEARHGREQQGWVVALLLAVLLGEMLMERRFV